MASAAGAPAPQRVGARLEHLVPPQVRDLEPRDLEAGYAPGNQAQAGRIALLRSLEQHLQADADAEKRLAAGRLDHRLARAARAELAHAVGHRALAGHDDAVRRADLV